MKIWTAIMIVTLATLSFSCQKDKDIMASAPTSTNLMDDLNVPENFQWRTDQVVKMRLGVQYTGLVEIKRMDGSVALRVNVQGNQPMNVQFGLPDHQEKVMVVYNGNSVELQLTGGILNYSFTGKTNAIAA